MLNLVLPFIPLFLLRLITKNWADRIQGVSKNVTINFNVERLENRQSRDFRKLLAEKFYREYVTKTLLYTWIKLHLDFYYNEKFSINDFRNWSGETLILRTDNDPLMQDDGEFKKIYPNATVKTFSETGHLTDIYQFEKVVGVIREFLK